MGFVKNTGEDDDYVSDDEGGNVVKETSSPQKKKNKTLSTKPEESDQKPKKLASKDVAIKIKSKHLSIKKANELKAKAKGVVSKTSSKKENVDVAAKKVIVFRPKKLSPELAAICGKRKLSRQETLKRIWRYVKLRKLQDPAIKTKINCDEKLKAVTNKEEIDQREMLALLKLHMTDI